MIRFDDATERLCTAATARHEAGMRRNLTDTNTLNVWHSGPPIIGPTGWHDAPLSSIGMRYPREPQAGKPLYDERDPVAPGADSDLAFVLLGIVLGLGIAALGLVTWFALRGGRLWS